MASGMGGCASLLKIYFPSGAGETESSALNLSRELSRQNLSNGSISKKLLSICFVSQDYPEETGWGGIGTYTYEMAHGLARAGHKIVIVSRALTDAQHYFEADGVEVFRILPSVNLDSTPVVWRLNRWWEGY